MQKMLLSLFQLMKLYLFSYQMPVCALSVYNLKKDLKSPFAPEHSQNSISSLTSEYMRAAINHITDISDINS